MLIFSLDLVTFFKIIALRWTFFVVFSDLFRDLFSAFFVIEQGRMPVCQLLITSSTNVPYDVPFSRKLPFVQIHDPSDDVETQIWLTSHNLALL